MGVVASKDVDASLFVTTKEVSIEVAVSVLDKVLSDDSLLANVVGDSLEVSMLVMVRFSVDVDNSVAVVVVGLFVGNSTPNLLSYSKII